MKRETIFRLFPHGLLSVLMLISAARPVAAQDCDGNGLQDSVDEDGAIFFTSIETSTVFRYDIGIGLFFPVIDLADNKFISGIDVDPDEDKLYMAIENEGAIYRCNLDGTGLETDWRTGINEPNDIALRKPGSVFATRQNTVTIFPPDFFNVALSFPYTVDRIDEDSAVAFAIGSGSIFRISDGETEPVVTQTLVTGVSLASGLAYTNGQVFWADTGSGLLMRADVGAGQDVNVTPMFAPPPSSELTGVAANRDNNRIFFGTQDPDILYRVEADATFLTPIIVLPQDFGLYAIAHLPGARDCNNNGVQDACDISDPSKDCNGDYLLDVCQLDGTTDVNNNDVLDECEPDCDFNTLPDDYDITQGAGDCDNDGVLDRCDTAPTILHSHRIDSSNWDMFTTTDGSDVTPFFEPLNVQRAEVDQLTGLLYWGRDGDLFRGNIDGTNSEEIPTNEGVGLLTVDSLARRLYFSVFRGHSTGYEIFYLNLNDLSEPAISIGTVARLPEVDSVNEWLIFPQDDGIHRVDFGGTNELVIQLANFDEFSPIEYDPTTQTIYFANFVQISEDAIWRMDVDGSNQSEIFNAGYWINDIELDWPTNTIFYRPRFVSENGPPFVLLEAIFKKQLDTSAPPVQITEWNNANPTRLVIRGLIRQPIDCNENGVPDSCESLADCNNDGTPDVCQLFSNDCDGNGILDECDLAGNDCNNNGVPDACDEDCNDDGTPDDCQLAGNDCNSNGVIDECDLLPTLDQDNLDLSGTGASNIQGPREQTFTPATSVLNGLQIGLADGSFDFPNDFITVKVFRDAMMIGSATQEVFRPITGLTTFYFDMPIVTTPGELLSFTVESDFELLVFFWEFTSTDTYPGGDRIFAGNPSGDWKFATIELRPFSQDCNNNGTLDDCEPGFVDCNLNGMFDICDLVDNDCNNNGIPDECDAAVTDCNGDGIPDDCQLAANDCNADGIPDECNLIESDCNNNGIVDQCEFEPQIDQSHLRDDGGSGNLFQGNNAGQTFTPTFELLEAIEVGLVDDSPAGSSELVTLRLLRGATVLATVGRTVTNPVPPVTRFTFNEPIEVTPGELLEFQLNDSGFVRFFWNQGPIGSTYPGGQGTFNGSGYSHDRSFQTLGRPQIFDDCNMNEVPDDCELMVRDCNNNGLLDDCEGLPDCDEDGILDECEIADGDCNNDGVPDDCQLINDDCNSNGILDECEIAGGTFNFGDSPNIPIPDEDPTGISSIIDVPLSGTIQDINVNIEINHTWQGDIVAALSHDGTTVTLINNSGGTSVGCTTSVFGYRSDDFGSPGDPLVLDDSAPVGIDCYDGPADFDGIDNYAGPAMPHEPLAAFNGLNASGEWTLTVSDPLLQETGTLVSWSIDVTTSSFDCNANTIPDDCELNEITLYTLSDDTDQILFFDKFGNTVRPAIDLSNGVYRAVGYNAAAQVMLYSSLSNNVIRRVNLDGSGTSTIISGSSQGRAFDFEFPSTGTNFFYCTGNGRRLYRATLGGTTIPLIENDFLINNISGIELDEATNSIYFTDQNNGRVWRTFVNSPGKVLIAGGLNGPIEIELDPVGGKLYFTEFAGRRVRRMNLDGSGLEMIHTSADAVGGLELDVENGNVYFTTVGTGQLLRCDFDGSNLQEIASVGGAFRMDASIATADCNGNEVPDECDVPTGGDCCTVGAGPGCSVQSVQDCVCAADPFCCDTEWDQLCVDQVESLGCGSCGPSNSNDCNLNLVPDECETENDCNANFIPDDCEDPLQGCGPGEECPDAIAVSEGTTTGDLGDNLGLTGNDDTCGGANNNIDEWFVFVPPIDGEMIVTTCNSGTEFDSTLAIFDDCPETGGSQLACNDDAGGGGLTMCALSGLNRKSVITLDVVAGDPYLIRLGVFNDSFSGQGGFGSAYELTIDMCTKGDLTGDNMVDAMDITPFANVLLNPIAATPADRCAADVNDDGLIDGGDIQEFMGLVLAQ